MFIYGLGFGLTIARYFSSNDPLIPLIFLVSCVFAHVFSRAFDRVLEVIKLKTLLREAILGNWTEFTVDEKGLRCKR